eukprot:CAMPEP_0117616648 /NCGR_PEP_ID=MMETSP0784-20121206/85170_1 /TAXON_ID=39447 /ORGANISM="" /LENGTH=366 /DNA_ID=CAMNT_0005420435 /DNA_START=98 /DNA_END=1198 /DNA_ORIENTATION=+
MGQSVSLEHAKPCPLVCCNVARELGRSDGLAEYEPQGKSEAAQESIEPMPPAAIQLSRNRDALEDRFEPSGTFGDDYNIVDDSGGESYFARELQELSRLPPDGREGPRPLYTFKSGATYLGQWKGNTRHGVGKQTWTDGATFVGQWHNNYADGLGRFVHSDGDVFVGSWKRNAAQGLGVYTTTYSGEWVEDLQHGYGVEQWQGGSKFHGPFHWGKKQGYGVYEWPDGSKYSGQWKANSINGYGHYIGKDGREFRGMWKEAVIHGCGKYSWPDGRTFAGQYTDDKKQGFGIFTWQDSRRFEGFWDEGMQHGHGITYKPSGEVLRQGMWYMGRQPESPEEVPEVSPNHLRDNAIGQNAGEDGFQQPMR